VQAPRRYGACYVKTWVPRSAEVQGNAMRQLTTSWPDQRTKPIASLPRRRLRTAPNRPELVAKGEIEIGMVVLTQILTTPGVELVGPLPAEVQSYVSFVAAVGSTPKRPMSRAS
jgi:hypothetical protein